MRMNKFLMLGIAGLAFAACSNEEEFGGSAETQGTKQVTVTIKTASPEIGTKGTQGNFTTATEINATDIDIYFLNATGTIMDIRNISEGEDSQGGKIFHGIEGSVTKIAATGNYDIQTTVALGTTNFSAIEAEAVSVNTYQAASTVPVYAAAANLTQDGTDEHGELWKAELTLSTQMSRIELGGTLTCTNLGTAYSKLDLAYIGINNTAETYTLSTGTGGTMHNASDNSVGYPVIDQTENTPENFYETLFTGDSEPFTYTYSMSAPDPAGAATITLSEVYAFNFVENCHLVLRFEPTVIPNESLLPNDPAYLKVIGLQTEGGEDVTIEAGNIYQLKGLTFKEEDLTPLVNDQICVVATVTVTPWELNTVTPVYDTPIM